MSGKNLMKNVSAIISLILIIVLVVGILPNDGERG